MPICATGRRWGRERMTTWLTTLEEESCGTENKGTAVNKYTCGGGELSFLASLGCLHIWREHNLFFFNMFVFQVSDNLNILFSSDKSFIGKKRRLSIIKQIEFQCEGNTWQSRQNILSTRDLNVNCGSFHSISKTVLPYILSQSLFYLPFHVYVHFTVQSYHLSNTGVTDTLHNFPTILHRSDKHQIDLTISNTESSRRRLWNVLWTA